MKEEQVYPYTASDFSDENALVLAPHPDDESIGCGGSILKHTKKGSRVKVIFITDGAGGDFEGRFGEDYVTLRRECAERALTVLDVNECEFWGYGERVLRLKIMEARKRLEETITNYKPSVVYVPSPFEIHPDHRATFSIAWDLLIRVPVKILLYEALIPLYPDTLVDITGQWHAKKRAIECYWTELYYNDYAEKMQGLNRNRSSTLSKEVVYAEAFLVHDGTGEGKDSTDTLQRKLMESIIFNR
jgi:LmbE family N-acetylglucosaminyl deacetylase